MHGSGKAAAAEEAVEKALRGKPEAGFPLSHSHDGDHFRSDPTPTPSPHAASGSSISIKPGGYDVTMLFQLCCLDM
jgi:hypothetical protein